MKSQCWPAEPPEQNWTDTRGVWVTRGRDMVTCWELCLRVNWLCSLFLASNPSPGVTSDVGRVGQSSGCSEGQWEAALTWGGAIQATRTSKNKGEAAQQRGYSPFCQCSRQPGAGNNLKSSTSASSPGRRQRDGQEGGPRGCLWKCHWMSWQMCSDCTYCTPAGHWNSLANWEFHTDTHFGHCHLSPGSVCLDWISPAAPSWGSPGVFTPSSGQQMPVGILSEKGEPPPCSWEECKHTTPSLQHQLLPQENPQEINPHPASFHTKNQFATKNTIISRPVS